MTNCKYITKNGRCGLKDSYAYRHGCFGEDMCKCREPMTNADRIRSMNDEDLAKWIDWLFGRCEWCDTDKIATDDCNDVECTPCILKWLKQPAKGE